MEEILHELRKIFNDLLFNSLLFFTIGKMILREFECELLREIFQIHEELHVKLEAPIMFRALVWIFVVVFSHRVVTKTSTF